MKGPRRRHGAVIVAACGGGLGLIVFGWGLLNQMQRRIGPPLTAANTWFWWALGVGAALAIIGAYLQTIHGRRGGLPLLVLGGLACIPATLYAVQLGVLSARWSLSGMITDGVPFAGYHWIPQVVLMAFALVLVLALLIVALILAWGFGSKPRSGGRVSRPRSPQRVSP